MQASMLTHTLLLLPAAVCLQELASAPKLKSLQLEGNPFDDKKMPKVRPACLYDQRRFASGNHGACVQHSVRTDFVLKGWKVLFGCWSASVTTQCYIASTTEWTATSLMLTEQQAVVAQLQ
jgi:hypothetical protein